MMKFTRGANMYKLITLKNKPYELDRLENEDGIKIAAITRKNIDFISAVIRLDSNYSREHFKQEPDKGFDPIQNVDSFKKYCGSMEYWLDSLSKSDSFEEYRRNIYGAIISIDRANSTHLGSSKSGRAVIAERILRNFKTVNELKGALLVPFSQNDKNHIIAIISKPIDGVRENTVRINLSFATKFCAYTSMYLLKRDLYSKYDNVVAENLHFYANAYLNRPMKCSAFKSNSRKLEDKLKIYSLYSDVITSILEAVKKKIGEEVTREEFDHIVWYCNK